MHDSISFLSQSSSVFLLYHKSVNISSGSRGQSCKSKKKAETSFEISAFHAPRATFPFGSKSTERLGTPLKIDPYKTITQKQPVIFAMGIDPFLGHNENCPRRYLSGCCSIFSNKVYVFLLRLTTCVFAIKSPNRLPLFTKTTIPSICTIT